MRNQIIAPVDTITRRYVFFNLQRTVPMLTNTHAGTESMLHNIDLLHTQLPNQG